MSKAPPHPRRLSALLDWYHDNARVLPWRKTKRPYLIWVSEILLQQTQVSRGEDYYQRFIKKYPHLRSLSSATWRELLPVWRGLGYYNRGKNMIRAAKIIQTEHGGRFPKEREALQALPGIGPYTASAILSFAFDQPVLAIDTNVKRVLSRFLGCPPEKVSHFEEKICRVFARRMRDLNQALMDLGSSHCKGRMALCESCPLQRSCHFFRSGMREQWQRQLARGRSKPPLRSQEEVVEVGVACIHKNGLYLLAKRPRHRGGLWEFPGGKKEAGESIRACLKREIKEELGIEISVRPHFLSIDSKQEGKAWRLVFCRCQILRGKERNLEHDELRWVSPEELKSMDLPEANRQALKYLSKMR